MKPLLAAAGAALVVFAASAAPAQAHGTLACSLRGTMTPSPPMSFLTSSGLLTQVNAIGSCRDDGALTNASMSGTGQYLNNACGTGTWTLALQLTTSRGHNVQAAGRVVLGHGVLATVHGLVNGQAVIKARPSANNQIQFPDVCVTGYDFVLTYTDVPASQ